MTRHDVETRALGQPKIFPNGPVSRVLDLAGRADETARHEKVQSRLQVRQVRHRDEEFPGRREDAAHF